MKLTLAFQVYNKEQYIGSVVDSWVSNLSGQNECEPRIWQVDSDLGIKPVKGGIH